MTPFTPSYDNKIKRKYSLKTIDQKVHNKTDLQEEIGWPKETKVPVMCIPMGVSSKSGGDLLEKVLPGILSMDIQLLIVGKGEKEYGEKITKLAKEEKHRLHIVKDHEDDLRKMYAASDMALFLVDPADAKELQHSLSYGVVPIAPETKELENYNAIQETGSSFVYKGTSEWHVFAGIVRAMETFNFPYDYRTIQRHCMEKGKAEE